MLNRGSIVMTPKTRRKLQLLADQLNVQVEQIEKPPYDIVDNTDDVEEPKPAEITNINNSVRQSMRKSVHNYDQQNVTLGSVRSGQANAF